MNLLQRTKNKLIQNKLRNMKGIFVLQNAYWFSHGESLSNKMKTQTICILNRPFLLLLSEVEVDKIEIICD